MFRSRLFGVCLLAAMVPAAACTDDTSAPPATIADAGPLEAKTGAFADVAVATAAAGPARISGTSGAPGGEPSGDVNGVVSTAPEEGVTTFALPVDGTAHPVELRWTPEAAYIDRVEVPQLAEGQPTVFVHLPDQSGWARSSFPYGALAINVFNPAMVLGFAGAPTAVREEVGTENVGGTETRHITVTGVNAASAYGGPWTQFDLWIDDSNRLRRVKAAGERIVVDYELVEFGVDLVVEPVAAEELGPLNVGLPQPDPAPTGPMTEVARGESEGIQWTLFKGPSNIQGGDCWRLETSEPFSQAYANLPDGTICPVPVSPDDPLEFLIQFPIDGDGTSPVDAIVAVLPPDIPFTSATIGFFGGATEPIAIDQERHLVVWVGLAPRVPGYMQLVVDADLSFGCGPGHVTAVSDLMVTDPVVIETLKLSPWLCLQDD